MSRWPELLKRIYPVLHIWGDTAEGIDSNDSARAQREKAASGDEITRHKVEGTNCTELNSTAEAYFACGETEESIALGGSLAKGTQGCRYGGEQDGVAEREPQNVHAGWDAVGDDSTLFSARGKADPDGFSVIIGADIIYGSTDIGTVYPKLLRSIRTFSGKSTRVIIAHKPRLRRERKFWELVREEGWCVSSLFKVGNFLSQSFESLQ